MELRGNRSYFEDLKYNTANWRYNWTARKLEKTSHFPARPVYNANDIASSSDRPPLYFPSVLAFLCSTDSFNWELELWEVVGENEALDLNLSTKIIAKVTGLGIPFPSAQTLQFSEAFVPLTDGHQTRANINDPNMPAYPLGTTGWTYWTEETELLDRTVTISPNTLGLTDLTEYQKQWEFRAHGRLLDMAVYAE